GAWGGGRWCGARGSKGSARSRASTPRPPRWGGRAFAGPPHPPRQSADRSKRFTGALRADLAARECDGYKPAAPGETPSSPRKGPILMALERTFSIIKPDATARNLTGAINPLIEQAGLRAGGRK